VRFGRTPPDRTLDSQTGFVYIIIVMKLTDARALFPAVEDQLYLNHAASSPFSLRVEEALRAYLDRRVRGDLDDFKRDLRETADLRSALAALIGSSPDRIALTSNTTHGLNIVAGGIHWEQGDQILLSDMEFPANVYPFLNTRRFGTEVVRIPSRDGRITPDDLRPHLTDRTRLFSVSYVQYLNGYRADLEALGEFCRRHDILFIIDAIQGLGALPLDVSRIPCDAVACGGHKWLMSPKGTGFLYITEDLQDRLEMAHFGWMSVRKPFEFHHFDQETDSSAQRYELATPNQLGIYGMHAAVRLLQDVGLATIRDHLLNLTGYLRDRLPAMGCEIRTPFPDRERAGILLFSRGDARENHRIFQALAEQGITISFREGALRVAPHFYNNRSDMDRFLAALGAI